VALERNLHGFEGRSFAGLGITGATEVTLISSAAVRSGARSARVARAVASNAATGFEDAFTSMGASDGQRMVGRLRYFVRLAAYPSANDCRVGGWSGQRATRLELNTTGQFRLYSDWISGFTTSYTTESLALNQWYQVDVYFEHDRGGAQDSTHVILTVSGPGVSVGFDVPTTFGGALPTFNVDRVIFGNNPAGGPVSTYDMLFDDIVFWIGSDADAVTVDAGLPARDKIFPVLINGQGIANTFSGSFADVDEVPMNGGDFQDGDNGEQTIFTHEPLESSIDALKLVANATITSGTQTEPIVYPVGTTHNVSLTTATGSDNVATQSVAIWETVTAPVFNARQFGMESVVAGQVVRLFNMFGEALTDAPAVGGGGLAVGTGPLGGGGGSGGGSGIGGGTGGPSGGPSGGPGGGGGGPGLGAIIGIPRAHIGD
jgi:hypothetical protein